MRHPDISLVNSAVRVAIDLNIFNIIKGPSTLTELAQATGADPIILKGIMRLLTAHRYFKQSDTTLWETTALSKAMTSPIICSGEILQLLKPSLGTGHLHEWLSRHQWQLPMDQDDTVVKDFLGTDL